MSVSWPGPPEHQPEAGPGLEYHRLHEGGRPGWWRALVGVVALVAAMLVFVPAAIAAPLVIWLILNGESDLGGELERLLDTSDPTPVGLAVINLSLAAAIPVTFLIIWALHGLRPRWLSSVMPRIRWRYLVSCLGLSVVALGTTLVLGSLLPGEPAGEMSGGLNSFDRTAQQFALVVLLLTPLQAAGEEYAFRGYLTQVFGGWFGRWGRQMATYAAVLGPATLFALAHGAQDAPIFFDRFAFGVVAGILVVRTGGLEAGIAMHVLNNFVAFGLALAIGDMGDTLTPTGGTWWSIPVTLTQSLVYLGLALLLANRMGLRRTADPVTLIGSMRH